MRRTGSTLALHAVRVLVLTRNPSRAVTDRQSPLGTWEKVLTPAGIALEQPSVPAPAFGGGRSRLGSARAAGAAAYLKMLRSLRSLDDYDAVLVYRQVAPGPPLVERWVSRRKPVIYVLDDPLYVTSADASAGYGSYRELFGKLGQIAGRSRVVIVNSRHHSDHIRRFTPIPARLIPDVVDGDLYRPAAGGARTDGGLVRLGWSGSPSTVRDLRVVEQPLQQVVRRLDARLHLVGVEEQPLAGMTATTSHHRDQPAIDELRSFDVGLVPLADSNWNRRKFFYEVVEYMALGIPVVGTPLGSNPEVIEDGRTGFLAETPEAWVEALERLIADAALRAEMGARAAEVAHREHTVQANAEKIVSAFRAALG
jgi:glycosyltransferase involved in cell wall biosynthesis